MGNEIKIKESILYDVWQNHDFKNAFFTSDGEEIFIIEKGVQNSELAGPDFHNAKIRIGNLTYIGDVEIDNSYTDWKAHGHHIDNKYNKVILHASLFNNSNVAHVYTREGRKVNSICLRKLVDKEELYKIKEKLEEQSVETTGLLKCSVLSSTISNVDKEKIIYDLGVDRFEKKCSKIFSRLKEIEFIRDMKISEPVISYDLNEKYYKKRFTNKDLDRKEIWQQLFYELLFEALGYSKNKMQMTEISKHANISFLSKIEKDGILIDKYEAMLLYISGLINQNSKTSDDESKAYLERLSINWNSIRTFYDGEMMDESQWHYFRLRPQNFPTIRIAGGARILFELLHGDLIKQMIKKIIEVQSLSVLLNSLRSLFIVKADGYWRNHYVFDSKAEAEIKYFIGASRADEIIVNVVIPFFAVYFDVFGNENLSRKIFKMYSMVQQKAENKIITDVANALGLQEESKKTIISQGMIELFRNDCSKNRCLDCKIGKIVFN